MDATNGRSSRANLVGAFAAGGAALVVHTLRPLPASTADNDPVLLGQENNATNTTSITSGDVGLRGLGARLGLEGRGDGVGVLGEDLGGDPATTPGVPSGVHGGSGYGRGVSDFSPQGVRIYAAGGDTQTAALQVDGKARFERSGRLTVLAGSASATKSGIALSPEASYWHAPAEQAEIYLKAAVPRVSTKSSRFTSTRL